MPNSFSGIGGWNIKDSDWQESKTGISAAIEELQNRPANSYSATTATPSTLLTVNNLSVTTVQDNTATNVNIILNNDKQQVPNFIVEFYNTTACNVNVMNNSNNMHSTSITSMESNKNYQLIALGNCWSLNEFTMTNNHLIISDGSNIGNLTINNDNIII